VAKKWYDALPTAVREAIDRAARESWAHQQKGQRAADETMWAEWKAAGVKVFDLRADERAKWVAAVGYRRPEWNESKERYGRKLVEKIAEFGAA